MHFYSVNASNILNIRLLGPQLIKKFLSVHGFRSFITVLCSNDRASLISK